MEMNPQKSLDEQLESVINARKTSPGQRIVWIIVLAVAVFVGYRYRGSLMSLDLQEARRLRMRRSIRMRQGVTPETAVAGEAEAVDAVAEVGEPFPCSLFRSVKPTCRSIFKASDPLLHTPR